MTTTDGVNWKKQVGLGYEISKRISDDDVDWKADTVFLLLCCLFMEVKVKQIGRSFIMQEIKNPLNEIQIFLFSYLFRFFLF